MDIKAILEKHEKWLRDESGGEMANLCAANLSKANLSEANLIGADLSKANLNEADLHRANLNEADLRVADLRGASLCGANLHGANLYGANLHRANLNGANLAGRKPLYADTDRNYVLCVFPKTKEPMFVAGCRCFTYEEAVAHWGPGSDRSQPKYIEAIEAWRAAR